MPLLVLLAVYWTAAILSHLNIGQRHILPTYAPMFILAGGAVAGITRFGKTRACAMGGAIVVSTIWFIGESFHVRPNYLAYFNQLAGGPDNGYRHLVDSSLDWGQSLGTLGQWLADNHLDGESSTPVYLSYFGGGDPAYEKIRAISLPHIASGREEIETIDLSPYRGGVYCISASVLQGVYLDPPGPWTVESEKAYRWCLAQQNALAAAQTDVEARRRLASMNPQAIKEIQKACRDIRLARLCAFLRHREPDAKIGYSILVYRLGDLEVNEALFGPPPLE